MASWGPVLGWTCLLIASLAPASCSKVGGSGSGESFPAALRVDVRGRVRVPVRDLYLALRRRRCLWRRCGGRDLHGDRELHRSGRRMLHRLHDHERLRGARQRLCLRGRELLAAGAPCSYSVDGTCNCGGPTIDLRGAYCNPTSEVGPGGEWQELFALDGESPCTFETCDYEWHVTPDGQIQMRKLGVESSATLASEDLAELDLVINGPVFRRDVDNVVCPESARTVSYGLVLPEGTHLMGVECFIDGNPENNPYQRIWAVLQKY